ncbi:MAG: hypothetical protein NZM25_08765 [Leptospiraceae bacterium]|nr:hypothetical protein [Leptospiraceae bacterium]MDW8306809.1 hypothetical protein [Leptospiraceae bacterium]
MRKICVLLCFLLSYSNLLGLQDSLESRGRDLMSAPPFLSQDGIASEEEESPIRRSEVLFLVSFPFTLLLNAATTYTFYQIATGKNRYTVPLWVVTGMGAVLFSTAIVWYDGAHQSHGLRMAYTYLLKH